MLQPQERLRLAVIEGNLPIAKRLLSRFPELWLNIDYQNNGWSNLHYASNGGNYLVCFHLISLYNHRQSECKDLQITPFDLLAFDQMLVIHLAAENHHIQTLHYLLQEFPGSFWLNSPGGCHGRTPLHLSCIKGFQEGIRLLVEYGADPAIKDNLGNTSLHYLFEYEHMECVWAIHQVILRNAKSKDEAEAFLNKLELIKNNKGSTALDYAPSVAFRNQYKKRKQHVLSQDLNGTILELADLVSRKSALTLDETKSISSKGTLTSTATNANCSLSNKFPVIEADVYPSLDDELITKRAHSQSLPTDLPQPTKISEHPTTTRRRSNTTIAKASTGTPQPPTATCGVYPKPPPPPLKSITISPSIRNSSFSLENVTLTESRPFSVVLPQLPHNDLSSSEKYNGNLARSSIQGSDSKDRQRL
ncbi:uncharacterized protein KQ657_000857 [Scheffersomyces spartinae]|uniref:Uncharacterized protein n=1 Tax=Scheffersomyces spartinae TaxID=45513 RepID=A0A9P8AIA3_9ASCO|nr:uncharacterized protein KQ657_000857 [Scheffersomyces spartinae]KAG7193439.1 hypothetical protein KQ657_000857 [Scheffersomyces spartinae]